MSEQNKPGNRLVNGIIMIFIANVINLLFSVGTNLILPKHISVESYAAIKTYQLYITYVGVLHFGYNDGMYLKYGGRSFDDLNKEEVLNNLSTLRIFQLFVMIICIIISYILKDTVLLMSAIAVFPMNLKAYYQSLYQAIGEFGVYSKIMNAVTGITFFINIILIFVFKTDKYIYFLALYVLLNFVIWGVLEIYFQKNSNCRLKWFVFDAKELVLQIKSGILIMLGNFSDSIMTSMDRWFVKLFVGTIAFAQYAFAVSMEHFLSVAVSPLSITLYNYLCKNVSDIKIKKLRSIIVLFSAFLVCAAFPVSFIIEVYLPNYVEAIFVLYLLFASQIFFTVVKSVYVNLYKAKKMQRIYFYRWISVIVVAFVSNVLLFFLIPKKEAFALATLISSIYWFIISSRDFLELRYSFSEVLFMSIETIVFLLIGSHCNPIVGFLAYFSISVLLAFILLRESVNDLLDLLMNKIHH